MDRRKFLKFALSTGALSQIPFWTAPNLNEKTQDLLILHTNDIHSRVEPFPKSDRKYAYQGGLSRLAKTIENIRKTNDYSVLLDAGDVFQGTPYFNFFGGNLEYQLMSEMRYDAGTLGNHDFDGGVAGLHKAMENLRFPLLNCNYDFTASALDKKILPYQIIQKGRVKIGLIGVGIRLKGLVPDALCAGITYHDPISIAESLAKELKKRACHIVICLSHLGFQYENSERVDDIQLAQKTRNIDVIIGGHTHTFMDQPLILANQAGKNVLIHQVGWAGLRLGMIRVRVALQERTVNFIV